MPNQVVAIQIVVSPAERAEIARNRTAAQLVGSTRETFEAWMECEDCEIEFHVEAEMTGTDTAEAECPQCGCTMIKYFD